MTRKSKREIAERLEDLEDGDAGKLDGRDMYAWIESLTDEEGDIERPPEFYPDGVEWSEALLDIRDAAAKRFPPLKHLTPPEVYVLSYMDEDVAELALELLVTSEGLGAQKFLQEIEDLADDESAGE